MERRTFEGDIRVERADGSAPRIIGHAAVFDLLSENLGGFREKIARGAFDGVLGDDVRALFNHESSLILGRTPRTLSVAVDERGLRYEIEPPDTTTGRDLLVSLDRGDVTQSSFGFSVDEDRWDEDDEGRVVRTIMKVKRLYDVSPVTFPAYTDTDVAKREFRDFMAAREKARGSEHTRALQARTMSRLGVDLWRRAGISAR